MGRPTRILLVDDEPDLLESMSFWFASKGYEVQQAPSGEAALSLLKTLHPDVVFLDVNMPRMDGIETLRRIRATSKTLPVILVTASGADENKFVGAKALGISGLFPKGGSLTQLGDVLEAALRVIRTPPAPPDDAPHRSPRTLLGRAAAFLRTLGRT